MVTIIEPTIIRRMPSAIIMTPNKVSGNCELQIQLDYISPPSPLEIEVTLQINEEVTDYSFEDGSFSLQKTFTLNSGDRIKFDFKLKLIISPPLPNPLSPTRIVVIAKQVGSSFPKQTSTKSWPVI